MSAFSDIIVVSDLAFPATPQVVIPFEPKSITIINESTMQQGFVSFDGVNDQGHLLGRAVIEYEQRVTKVWLRKGGGANINIQVLAES